MIKLCDIDVSVKENLPPTTPDKSGIGVHYVDAFIKPMNTTLGDGTVVSCERRGLKLTLSVGSKKGEGLLRRLESGPDPVAILSSALREAAESGRIGMRITDTEIHLEV